MGRPSGGCDHPADGDRERLRVHARHSVRVSSIPALLTALADNTVTDIVVANGTYRVSRPASQASDSLWIGSRFAGRTRAVTVRAETSGGVTFDGGGATALRRPDIRRGRPRPDVGRLQLRQRRGDHTGVIMFGGYAGRAAPHHITLRNIEILGSCTGHNDRNDHAVYFSYAVGGPHDILIDGLTVDGTGPSPLSSALHFYHSDSTNGNAWNTTIRRLVVSGTYTAIFDLGLDAPRRHDRQRHDHRCPLRRGAVRAARASGSPSPT